MSHRPRSGRVLGRLLGMIGATALAVSPFIVYAAFELTAPAEAPRWPAPVAVAATTDGSLGEFALVEPGGSSRIILFPPETSIEVPGTGKVRALTAFRIEGIGALARGLDALIGSVPYWAEGRGVSALEALSGEFETNLGEHTEEVRGILSGALSGSALVIVAPGEWSEEGGVRTFFPDTGAVLSELRGPPGEAPLSPSPITSPAPSPTPTELDPPDVSVEVLNAGAPSGSAARIAESLEAGGFTISGIGNYGGPRVSRTEVYFRESEQAGRAVAALIGEGVPVQPLRAELNTDADVLVLVGPPT